MKTYKVKEIYYTIQGEGHHTGRPAVFCRFAGCNLWSGREQDRSTAICKFCDTDFWGTDGVEGGKYSAEDLVSKIDSFFPSSEDKMVVFTGGEPALQLTEELLAICADHQIYTAVETNGTLPLPAGLDWICVSPKADTDIILHKGHELKLVFPQLENTPSRYKDFDFEHFYLQPLDDDQQAANIKKCVDYCLENPQWKLSLQTHKIIGVD